MNFTLPSLVSRKDDFKIDLNDNYLTISGERKFTKEKKENNLYVVETQYGNFNRTFSLPENVDAGKITAAYNNGILGDHCPQRREKSIKIFHQG